MERTLIIYDNVGRIISISSGIPEPSEPIGVPFLWVEIPEGKQIKITDGIGVDTSVTPHQVILEDRPPTIDEKLSEKDLQITELKVNQFETNRAVDEASTTQQQLLELLSELGVI